MNLEQRRSIGSGALFPIKLKTLTDENNNPVYVDYAESRTSIRDDTQPDTSTVPKVGWYPEESFDLITNNLQAIFSWEIGQRFRQENFGHILWSTIEEPNTQVLNLKIKQFVIRAIQGWENRLSDIKVRTAREGSKLYIEVTCKIKNTDESVQVVLEYDNLTHTSYAY
jgi:Gene 25-like lysozyme.